MHSFGASCVAADVDLELCTVQITGGGEWYAIFRDPSGRGSLVLGHDVQPINDAQGSHHHGSV